MSDLVYNLTYFREQITFWEDLEPEMTEASQGLAAVPDIASWWPGLEAYFDGEQAAAINAVIDDFSRFVGEGAAAATTIAGELSQTARAYANTEAANDDEARRLWSEVFDEGSTTTGGGGPAPRVM